MLKKWLSKLLPKQIHYCSAKRFPIEIDIPSKAVKHILDKLHQAGYEAYLVGGAIRDVLLNIPPKDFDVVTNATPEQIHQLFRRSRIIGRRFQIVHVIVGCETIEVTTFRSGKKVYQNELGRIIEDNAYGNMNEDALRRDFTCNALYYDVKNREIIDYHNGLADIRAKQLVMIGNPSERYQEDPVRILRAIRLSGKLGFQVAPDTAQPIGQYASLLAEEPVARLFDELLKILLSGHALNCLKQMNKLGVSNKIHPLFNMIQMADYHQNSMAIQALLQTDQRIVLGKNVSVGFILAVLFWPKVDRYWQIQRERGRSLSEAMIMAVQQMRHYLEHQCAIPQRFCATMREIWLLQPQFHQQRGSRPLRMLNQKRFRAAYDFLLLRAETNTQLKELANWWTQFQQASRETRQLMIQQVKHSPKKQKRTRKNM